MRTVLGIHHVTAIAGDPQKNIDFYAGALGLRLVKRTVNFDDPGTYHFYYGDESGTPGSILTFFPWPGAPRGRQGPGQVGVISFSIPPSALGFWLTRLLHHGIKYQGPRQRGHGASAEQVIAFSDPDGLLLEIVSHEKAANRPGWDGARGVPAADAIRGFHGVSLWVENVEASERTLVESLGFRPTEEYHEGRRFVIEEGGPSRIVELRSTAGFTPGMQGVGTVHHVAWRAADDAAELALRTTVMKAGLAPTTVIDRKYFHSVYFREPGGILYELATDAPGFTVDEPLEHLGETLTLPSQYEPQRGEIEKVLPLIHLPGSQD